MKFLRINMTNKSINIEDVPQKYICLGGRALTSILVNDEVPPTCDPIGSENKLIFAPGLLSGTTLVNTSRLSIGAKSPLTGGIKESNVGGTVSAALGRLGFKAVILEGKATEGELFLLTINENGKACLVDAQEYKGMRTYALADKLLQTYGKKTGVLCIGPAGEFYLASASIQSTDVDGRPSRAAGRGGLGAVMGSKGLKAVVVDQRGKSAYALADPKIFEESAKVFARAVKDHPVTGQAYRELGTAMLVAPINAAGAFPSYNAKKGVLEGWKNISGEKLAETIAERGGNPSHMACAQCIIHCSNEFVDKKGKYVTSGLEYETIWSMGGMTGITDLDTIARLDFLCDDVGVDTMNTGVAIAVAMDAGYKGFGDGVAAVEMVEEIAQGSKIGKIIGDGPVAVGKHFNHNRVPVVKGQSIAAYDPRAIQGMAVTYATSPMGADHTAGWVVGENLAAFGGKLDPFSAEGQVEVSRDAQISNAAFDSTGLCLFAGNPIGDIPEAGEAFLKMIGAKLGKPFTQEDMTNLGLKVLKTEREFNRSAGFTQKDDRLPKFFYEEPLPPHNKTVVVSDEDMDRTFEF
ncbi:MAG: aldehyde ferredoxin oxidoreductase C-terminal domain-containing protein [Pseudomonadota bacterium]